MICMHRLLTALTMPTRASRISTQAWLHLTSRSRDSSVEMGSSSPTCLRDASENPPILLLEGDEFCVSDDGIARTLYQLEGAGVASSTQDSRLLSIEELYNLAEATKEFIVRQDGRFSDTCVSSNDQREVVLGQQAQGLVRIGPYVTSIALQEIDEGGNLFSGRAGTGATTWEASVAMGLHFANHPEELRGHIVEVGCGMGLGGILNHKVLQERMLKGGWDSSPGACDCSVTLTDGNDDVVKQCKENVRRNIRNFMSFFRGPFSAGTVMTTPIRVCKLDWEDFVTFNGKAHRKRYDTVIACDCAYSHTDVGVLSKTLQGLLKEESGKYLPRPTVHLFGPHNRSALQEVIQYLRDELDMQVLLESVEMSRFRLKPFRHSPRKVRKTVVLDECLFASRASAEFLHVTAIARQSDESGSNLSSID